MKPVTLDLSEIQGDILIGLQKNAENFIFFKLVDLAFFRTLVKRYVLGSTTNSTQVKHFTALTWALPGMD